MILIAEAVSAYESISDEIRRLKTMESVQGPVYNLMF